MEKYDDFIVFNQNEQGGICEGGIYNMDAQA
jgi:hypothetical protein